MKTCVNYGVPWRQLALILVLGLLLFAGSVTIAVVTPYFLLAALLLVVQFAVFLKIIGRHASATGEALLTEDALLIDPRRPAIGASGKAIRIPWGEVLSVNIIAPIYGTKPLMILKKSTPSMTLRITVCGEEKRDFLHDVVQQAEAWHAAHPELPPLRHDDPFSGPLWRGLGWLGIAGIVSLVFGIFYSEQASDWSSWLRLLWLVSVLFPLLRRVFRHTVPSINQRTGQISP